MYRVTEPGSSERLGTTRDDAAGEALDKGAALLGLPYPGGPSIQEEGAGGDRKAHRFPRTLLDKASLDFSFSGLKTALLYHLEPPGGPKPDAPPTAQEVKDLAASYQEAIVDVLVTKLRRAAERHPVQSLCIGGGVAKNERLRERLASDPVLRSLRLVLPPLALCADNGAMIAGLGAIQLDRGVTAPLDLDAVATSQTNAKAKTKRTARR